MIFIRAAVVNAVDRPGPVVEVDGGVRNRDAAVNRRTAGLKVEIVRRGRSVDQEGVRVHEVVATDCAAGRVILHTPCCCNVVINAAVTNRGTRKKGHMKQVAV